MPYPAMPDRRMPYDIDGTVVGYSDAKSSATHSTDASVLGVGIEHYLSGSDLIELNDGDYSALSVALEIAMTSTINFRRAMYWLFPEEREVSGIYLGFSTWQAWTATYGITVVEGSDDTTNGVDGTWETATMSSGMPNDAVSLDGWRARIMPVSFAGAKKGIRLCARASGSTNATLGNILVVHLYGEKSAGETPDDLIFINHDDTPGVEYTAPEDFGDRPLDTSVVRQFRVKNASTTKTANDINLQCNHADFAISEDNVNWVVTIDIASLAAEAESSTLYVRNTTPAAGALLGPFFARIIATVDSWT